MAKKFSFMLNEIRLWYWHLGHHSFSYSKRLFPSLFKNINMSQFNYEVCELAKHSNSICRACSYKKISPFYSY